MDTISVVETNPDGMVIKLVTYPSANVRDAEELFCQLVAANENVTVSVMSNLLESGFYSRGPEESRHTIQLVWSTMA